MAHKKNGSSKTTAASKKSNSKEVLRAELKTEREGILLWKRPFTTLHYSFLELITLGIEFTQRLMAKKLAILLLSGVLGVLTYLYNVDGPHQPFVQSYEKYFLWCVWWVGLGVLSSVGLGTGLHTFILYLGPHIAAVTMAAYECGSTDFPEPPYPESILCPSGTQDKTASIMTVWQIMSKVRVECICWGAGTALGELPPYFVARAHRLSGYDSDEEDEDDELKELEEKWKQDPSTLSIFDKAKLGVEKIVERVGFFGILACASIPNPLFDLAGITCGHFLVPFWTFFGATLIGKAVIKMHIQKLFIIMSFNEKLISGAMEQIRKVPYIGSRIQGPFQDFLRQQKEKLHSGGGGGEDSTQKPSAEGGNFLSEAFGKLVLLMIAYFLVSIINSLAQNHHKRLHKKFKDK
uniref:Transmembrane protein 49 n=1 Tax=Caligus rogercresseyi TaxID=217165 RepID=C1BMG8_CALRO|nr:Transmembrane protein 49 [Caligus rogercresseyi]|eukprot:TRINITY_DN1451_c0_g1_i1.p1 TRINITY_DN1451_c0_g1~~TRINITY_DN1451_c0_g1_i1.p1  ORF type:complete len:407 (-),score=89.62 TRINITY_DN1451_c0_g1_i1:513-1733(-)